MAEEEIAVKLFSHADGAVAALFRAADINFPLLVVEKVLAPAAINPKL